jgi:hypothetical protein
MELARLDKYKTEYKEFRESINSLQTYLNGVSRSRDLYPVVTLDRVSEFLHVPELIAIFLLSLAEREHLVNKIYKVWTEDDTLLGEFPSDESIPEELTDDNTGKMVDKSHAIIDLVFQLER